MQAKALENRIKKVEDTDDTLCMVCPHSGCGHMAYGAAKRAILDDDSSLTFVECEGCKQIVWSN